MKNRGAIFQTSHRDGIFSLTVPGQFGGNEALTFRQILQQVFQGDLSIQKVVLDFSKTTFLDGFGVIELAKMLNITRQQGVECIVRNVNPTICIILSITGLEQFLTVEI